MEQNPMAYRNKALMYLGMDSVNRACTNLTYSTDLGFTEQYGRELNDLIDLYCK